MALSIDHRFGYPASELSQPAALLAEYITQLKQADSYASPEGFLHLPRDTAMIDSIQQMAVPAECVVLIGIGGSSQGAAGLARALKPEKKLIVVDAVNPGAIEALKTDIEGQKFSVFIVSKSGTTLETNANLGLLAPIFSDLDSGWQTRATAITDEGSPLWKYAEQKGWKEISSIPSVPGRFSILSPIALLPLATLGVDIKKLCASALQMQETCLEPDINKNPALWGAAAAFLNYKNGKAIHSIFSLDAYLTDTAKWWQQLMGESLSKDGKGILPILSGAADLHSLTQYYFDGPNQTYTTFLITENNSPLTVSDTPIESLKGKTAGDIMRGIGSGVQAAYEKKKLPFSSITFEELDESTLGAFCALKMLETVYMAKLMGMNAFDQPGVELYKQEVKTILKL